MLELSHVFTAFVDIGEKLDLHDTAKGRRRIVPILGGSVSGPRLSAEILPGGADWQIVRPDGTADVVARYTLRATDGTLISVVNTGLRRGPPEILARIAAGEAVDPAAYYFRTSPVFEVGAGAHGWLADNLFVATGGTTRHTGGDPGLHGSVTGDTHRHCERSEAIGLPR